MYWFILHIDRKRKEWIMMYQEKMNANQIHISKLLGKVWIKAHDSDEVKIETTNEEQVSITQQVGVLFIESKIEEHPQENTEKKSVFGTIFGGFNIGSQKGKTIINTHNNQTIIIGNGNVVSNGVVINGVGASTLTTVAMTIYVPKDKITAIGISGVIQVDVEGISDTLDFDQSGQTTLSVKQVKTIELDTSGQSTATLQDIEHLNADISGQSKAVIQTTTIKKATLDISGQSSVAINADTTELLEADLSGMSNLKVKGTVWYKEIDTSGMSKVIFQ